MQDAARVVDEVLAVLAARFGSTGEHLWAVMIRQAYVEFAVAAFAFVGLGIAAYVVWSRQWEPDPILDDPGPAEVAAKVFATIGFAIAFFFVLVTLGGALNPEYYALQKVLGAL